MTISKHTLLIGTATFVFSCAYLGMPNRAEAIQSLPNSIEMRQDAIHFDVTAKHAKASLKASLDKRNMMSSGRHTTTYAAIQLKSPLTKKSRTILMDNKIRLVSKLNESHWIAELLPVVVDNKSLESIIHRVGKVPAAAKLDKQLLDKSYMKQATRSGNKVAVIVAFYRGVQAEEVKALAKHADAELEKFQEKAFPAIRIAHFIIDKSKLSSLAESSAVSYIQPYIAEDTDENLASSQPLINVDDVQVAPYSLTGNGQIVGVWEAGDVIRASHQDLTPRVTVAAGQTADLDDHAAHVAGTIGSSGMSDANAEGMATSVTITSYDSTSDSAEMATAAAEGAASRVRISSHSYSKGSGTGWNSAGSSFTDNQDNFGKYDANSQAFDDAIHSTNLATMVAAGNDRGSVWDGTTFIDVDGDGAADNPPADCQQNGYAVDGDCIGTIGSAKNTITVGGITTGPARVYSPSGFGPTDDGRIKPDVMAQANNVYSLGGSADNDYGNSSGTSMATPAVSGTAALIREEAANNGMDLSAASMKAILIQTAQDLVATTDGGGALHSDTGPDFATGWGTVDALAAMDLLRRAGGPGVIEDSLSEGDVKDYAFHVPAGETELKVTLAWTDPAGDSSLASDVAQLVNDLDLVLIEPDGVTEHQPWILDPANPEVAAVRNGGDDDINPVEQVSVENPTEGTWTARVVTDGALMDDLEQPFALAGPLTQQKSDIIMVLDRSGSMSADSGAGITKLEAVQNSAHEFIDYVELVSGHQLGLVSFNHASTVDVPLATLDAASVGAATAAVNALSASGGTNIIDGVGDAVSELASTGVADNRKIVFSFSDGKHNSPAGSDLNDINASMTDDTIFYSVGYGTDVDSAILEVVADDHNGGHYEEQSYSPTQLSKLFMTVAGLSVNEEVIIDPNYSLAKGEAAKLSAVATNKDKAFTFATHWETPDKERLNFSLQSPSGKCKIPDEDHDGYATRAGEHYRLVRITFPYQCRNTGKILHSGEWTLTAQANEDEQHVNMMLVGDTPLRLRTDVKIKQSQALITASLQEYGIAAKEMPAEITAIIHPNAPSTNDSAAADLQGTDKRTRDALMKRGIDGVVHHHDRAIDAVRPQLFKKPRAITVNLNDRGIAGDKKAGDGVYSVTTKLKAGRYQARFIAQIKDKAGLLAREALKGFVVGKR